MTWKQMEIDAALAHAPATVARDLDYARQMFIELMSSIDPYQILEGVCLGLTMLNETYAKFATFENSEKILQLLHDQLLAQHLLTDSGNELGGLYWQARARLAFRRGELELAVHLAMSAMQILAQARNLQRASESIFVAGKYLLRAGYIHPGESYLQQFLNVSDDSELRQQASRLLLDINLLRREVGQDDNTVALAVDSADLNWGQVRSAIIHHNDYKAIIKAVSPAGQNRSYDYALEAVLWLHLSDSSRVRDRALKPESIRKLLGSQRLDISSSALMEATVLLNDLYAGKHRAEATTVVINRYLQRVGRLENILHELLVWAALSRYHLVQKSADQGLYFQLRYSELSRQISGGHSDDVLKAFDHRQMADVVHWPETATARALQMTEVKEGSITKFPETVWQRSLVWTGLMLDLGVASGKFSIKKMFRNDAQLLEDFSNEFSRLFLKHISKMKGPVVKLAELACILGFEFPKSATEKIAMVYNRKVQLPPKAIERAFQEQLHKKVNECFSDWNPDPIGAGSIAQVHAAQYQGKPVVVKVRYPGVYAATQADIRMLRRLTPLFKRFYPAHDIDGIFAESTIKMLAECNLILEKENLRGFSERFAAHPQIAIPKVYESLCSEGVLTMERFSGRSLFEFANTATQAERNALARTLFALQYLSFFQHGHINVDPHPSNFMVLDDGRLGLFDFGLVTRVDDEYRLGQLTLLRAAKENDLSTFKDAMITMGYERCHNAEIVAFAFEWWRSRIAAPLIQERFVYDRDFLESLRIVAMPETPKVGFKRIDFYIPRFWLQFCLSMAILNADTSYRDLDPGGIHSLQVAS